MPTLSLKKALVMSAPQPTYLHTYIVRMTFSQGNIEGSMMRQAIRETVFLGNGKSKFGFIRVGDWPTLSPPEMSSFVLRGPV